LEHREAEKKLGIFPSFLLQPTSIALSRMWGTQQGSELSIVTLAHGTSTIKSKKAVFMSDQTSQDEIVRIPIMQRMLDNPFLLLFIGVVFPAVFYIIWGIMEIVTIPITN